MSILPWKTIQIFRPYSQANNSSAGICDVSNAISREIFPFLFGNWTLGDGSGHPWISEEWETRECGLNVRRPQADEEISAMNIFSETPTNRCGQQKNAFRDWNQVFGTYFPKCLMSCCMSICTPLSEGESHKISGVNDFFTPNPATNFANSTSSSALRIFFDLFRSVAP
jgi:hypothetical protein